MATIMSFLKEKLKALQLVWIGRSLFLALLMIQCGFFAAYPENYSDDARWIPIFLSYVPALVYWIYCLGSDAALIRMFFTWGLYMFALIPNIAIIFAVAGDTLDKEQLLGPNTLKVMLCITPVLFLFLLNTASDLSEHDDYRQLASRLSIQITIDLFDAVEMLDIVLDESQNSHCHASVNVTMEMENNGMLVFVGPQPPSDGIPKDFGTVMVAVACFSLLLSLLQLAENKLDDGKHKIHKNLAIVRNGVQIVFVNLAFLLIRAFIFFKYKKDESIFIAKNGIAIFLSSLEIYWLKHGMV